MRRRWREKMADADARMIAVRNPRTWRDRFHAGGDAGRRGGGKGGAGCARRRLAGRRSGLDGRIAIMQRWLGEVAKRANDIAEADAVDTGGCHTSYLQGFITMGNIGGWIEDAQRRARKSQLQLAPSKAMPTVEVRTQFVLYPLVGVIGPWNAPMMLVLLDAIPALVCGLCGPHQAARSDPALGRAPCSRRCAVCRNWPRCFDFVQGDGETGKQLIDAVDLLLLHRQRTHRSQDRRACARSGSSPAFSSWAARIRLSSRRAPISSARRRRVLRGAVHANGMVCFSVERYLCACEHPRRLRRSAGREGRRRFGSTATTPAPGISSPSPSRRRPRSSKCTWPTPSTKARRSSRAARSRRSMAAFICARRC